MNDPYLERWNQRFAGEHYHFGIEPNAFLVSQRELLRPGMSALAVADGEGRNGVWLAEQGLQVVSLDFSPVAIEKARRLAASRGVDLRLELADVEAWDWPEAEFDAVLGIFIQFASPPVRTRLFARMRRAAKPGGIVLLQGFGLDQPRYGTGGPSQIEHLYSEELLRRHFGDWEILHLATHVDEIHEGRGHNGLCALVDLVARKPRREGVTNPLPR